MRRAINWLVVPILMLTGCGGGGDDESGIEPPQVSGMLRKVRSAAELESSLKSSLASVSATGMPQLPAITISAGAGAAFSATYTAEAGVDEFDYARYDGTHLYIAPAPVGNFLGARSIRILRTDPANGTATQVSSIPVEDNQQVQGIYVANGRLVLLTSEYLSGPTVMSGS